MPLAGGSSRNTTFEAHKVHFQLPVNDAMFPVQLFWLGPALDRPPWWSYEKAHIPTY